MNEAGHSEDLTRLPFHNEVVYFMTLDKIKRTPRVQKGVVFKTQPIKDAEVVVKLWSDEDDPDSPDLILDLPSGMVLTAEDATAAAGLTDGSLEDRMHKLDVLIEDPDAQFGIAAMIGGLVMRRTADDWLNGF